LTRRRLGVLGGTFDPVHVAHLVVANEARCALALDEVTLVPANEPWQKVGTRPITPAADRLAMLQAAVSDARRAGVEGLSVSTVDVDRGGPTYTADTLAELSDECARGGTDVELVLIVGADVARDLHTWRRTEEIRARCTLAVVNRGDAVLAGGEEAALREAGWRFEQVAVPALGVSSTMVRDRLSAGRPVDFLVPPGAIHCIRERGLYAQGR
jgi:nicotinate-nucleotide adenylyltransferase